MITTRDRITILLVFIGIALLLGGVVIMSGEMRSRSDQIKAWLIDCEANNGILHQELAEQRIGKQQLIYVCTRHDVTLRLYD